MEEKNTPAASKKRPPQGQRRGEGRKERPTKREDNAEALTPTLFADNEAGDSESSSKDTRPQRSKGQRPQRQARVEQPQVAEEATETVESASTQPQNSGEESGAETTFEDLAFDPLLLQVMEGKGYQRPNPIQTEIFPLTLKGKDVAATIPNGNGKTAIFLLSAAHRLLATDIPKGTPHAPSILVFMSSKDDVLKTQSHSQRLLGTVGIKGTAIFENGDFNRQEGALRNGVDFVFTTPARAREFHEAGHLNFENVSIIICDDLGEVLANSNNAEILDTLIGEASGTNVVQKIFFSSEWSKETKSFAQKHTTKVSFINASGASGAPRKSSEHEGRAAQPQMEKQYAQRPQRHEQTQVAQESVVAEQPRKPQFLQKPKQEREELPQAQQARPQRERPERDQSREQKPKEHKHQQGSRDKSVQQWAYATSSQEKFQVLLGLIKNQKPSAAIVFANTKIVAEWVAYKLAGNGIKVEVCQSGISPEKRASLNDAIRAGEVQVVVTTDQGGPVSLDKVSHVYNFDIPSNAANFTARLETFSNGAQGTSVSLICEDYGYNMNGIEKELDQKIAVREIPSEFFDVKDTSDYPFDENGRVKPIGGGGASATPAVAEPVKPAYKSTAAAVKETPIVTTEPHKETRERTEREEQPRRDTRERTERDHGRDFREPRHDQRTDREQNREPRPEPRGEREQSREFREPRHEQPQRQERDQNRDFREPRHEPRAEREQGQGFREQQRQERPEREHSREFKEREPRGDRPQRPEGGSFRKEPQHGRNNDRPRREERFDERAREVGEATRAAARAASASKDAQRKPFYATEKTGIVNVAKESLKDALELVHTTVLDTLERKAPRLARIFEVVSEQIRKKD